MRNGLLWTLGVWLFGAGQLLAQTPSATDSAGRQAPAAAGSPAQGSSGGGGGTAPQVTMPTTSTASCCGFWARPEYLLWWLKSAPLPVPLVTTGDPNIGFDPNSGNTVNIAGAIGQPGTQILYGDQRVSYRAFSGLRLTIGTWLDDNELFGIEGGGFAIERLTSNFSAASDASGNPPLYFPIFSAIAGAERGIPIADPLRGFSGDVFVNSSLRLWGAEGNGTVVLVRDPGLVWTAFSGFRYADLLEHLEIHNMTTDLIFDNVASLSDSFTTRNQFYGGQLGSRLFVERGRCFLDVVGKVALGYNHEVVGVLGQISQAGSNPLTPPGPGTFPGGLFAQPSNIGEHKSDEFAALSSVELKLGYAISPRARAFVGYEFLYWSRVVRPGNQIDRNVNLTQNAVLDPNGAGVLVGSAQPAPQFNRSEFWAQGVNFGLEIQF
jgi:hypothetical protein